MDNVLENFIRDYEGSDSGDYKESKMREFDSLKDWIMSLIVAGFMVLSKEIDSEDVAVLARSLCRELGQPQNSHKWNLIAGKVDRFGLKSLIHRIRRELYWGLK